MTNERSHFVRSPAPWLAGASDVGRRHRTNQDALCLAARPMPEQVAVLAVADGVSSAEGSEMASLVATEAAANQLVAGLDAELSPNLSMVRAFADAQRAVIHAGQDEEPSACTLVAAVVSPSQIAVGNVGDSRAYWVPDQGECLLLSRDDSMAQARIMLGMSRDEAENSMQAHSITKWLGRDAVNTTPTVLTHQITESGWLLLCSDGLWNYASAPEDMQQLVHQLAEQTGHSPEPLAEALVAWANEQGGRDNITAALARLEPETAR